MLMIIIWRECLQDTRARKRKFYTYFKISKAKYQQILFIDVKVLKAFYWQ